MRQDSRGYLKLQELLDDEEKPYARIVARKKRGQIVIWLLYDRHHKRKYIELHRLLYKIMRGLGWCSGINAIEVD